MIDSNLIQITILVVPNTWGPGKVLVYRKEKKIYHDIFEDTAIDFCLPALKMYVCIVPYINRIGTVDLQSPSSHAPNIFLNIIFGSKEIQIGAFKH